MAGGKLLLADVMAITYPVLRKRERENEKEEGRGNGAAEEEKKPKAKRKEGRLRRATGLDLASQGASLSFSGVSLPEEASYPRCVHFQGASKLSWATRDRFHRP